VPPIVFGPNCLVGLDGQGNKNSSKETTRWQKVLIVNKNM